MEDQTILSEQKKAALAGCAKWAKVLAVLFFTIMGVMLLSVIVASISNPVGMISSVMILLVLFSFNIAFATLLYFFNKHTKAAIQNSDPYILDRALYNYKWFFALAGILVIVFVSLYCIFLIVLRLAI